MTNNSIPTADYAAIVRIGNGNIYALRFDAVADEEAGVVNCKEEVLVCNNATYDKMVSACIAIKYSMDAQLALLYNYQKDAATYAEPVEEYQNWRTYCKSAAKEFFGIDTEE